VFGEREVRVAFDWMEAPSDEGRAANEAAKLREMVLSEAARRTELYVNLRFSRADALARVRGNLRWEFEVQGMPAFLDDAAAVVNAIYDREEGEARAGGATKGARGRRVG
jgi:hypothetical protein